MALGILKSKTKAATASELEAAKAKLHELQQRLDHDHELNQAKATQARLEGQYEPLGKRAQEAFDAIGDAGGRSKLAGLAGIPAPEIGVIRAREVFESIQQQRTQLAQSIASAREVTAKRKQVLFAELEGELDRDVRPILLREQFRRVGEVLATNGLLLQSDQFAMKLTKARRYTLTGWSELPPRVESWKTFVTREFGVDLD